MTTKEIIKKPKKYSGVTHNMLTKSYINGRATNSGQKTTLLNGGIDLNTKNKIQNLEDKVEEQSNKLDKITSMLHAISEKTSAS